MRSLHLIPLSLLLCFSTAAFADLGPYLPENNNACPHLSSVFETVLFTDRFLRCGDVAGAQELIHKLNRWLPERIGRPRLALVMESQGSNAFFSSYALRVPLLLGGRVPSARDHRFNLFPNNVSRAVVAHEYGHAMLAHALSARNGLLREDFNRVRAYTRHWVIALSHEQRSLKELERLLKAFVERYGPEESWTEEERNEVLGARKKSWDEHLARVNELVTSQNKASEAITELQRRRAIALAPYHEFFADLVAALDAGDWAIMGKAIFTITGQKLASIPRDFSNPANGFESVEPGTNRFEAHDLLGPARFELYKRLKNERCLKPEPSLLIEAVLDAITYELQFPLLAGEVRSVAEREGVNRRFINNVFWRLDHLGSGGCR